MSWLLHLLRSRRESRQQELLIVCMYVVCMYVHTYSVVCAEYTSYPAVLPPPLSSGRPAHSHKLQFASARAQSRRQDGELGLLWRRHLLAGRRLLQQGTTDSYVPDDKPVLKSSRLRLHGRDTGRRLCMSSVHT